MKSNVTNIQTAYETLNELYDVMLNNYLDAIDYGIEALRKQIAQPLIPISKVGVANAGFGCASCRFKICDDITDRPTVNYCPNCGQLIKWEDD